MLLHHAYFDILCCNTATRHYKVQSTCAYMSVVTMQRASHAYSDVCVAHYTTKRRYKVQSTCAPTSTYSRVRTVLAIRARAVCAMRADTSVPSEYVLCVPSEYVLCVLCVLGFGVSRALRRGWQTRLCLFSQTTCSHCKISSMRWQSCCMKPA